MLFAFTACNHSSTNIDLQNEKEVRSALATRWEVEYMETRGNRIKVPESMVTHLALNDNGTFTTGVKNGVIKQEGKWIYDAQTQMLIMSRGTDKSATRILKLTSRELISSEYLTLNDEIMDSTILTYKRV